MSLILVEVVATRDYNCDRVGERGCVCRKGQKKGAPKSPK